MVVFATQFLKDALEGPLAAALNESCPNRFLLANAKAREPATRAGYHALGFNDAEIDRIARMVPKKDYYHSAPAGKRMFRLGLGPVGLQVCASSYPEALIRCDRIVASGGDFAERWFAETGLHSEADMVRVDRAGIPEVPEMLAAE